MVSSASLVRRRSMRKIMMMADEQGLVKASKVVDLLLDPNVNTMKQHYDRLKRMQEVIQSVDSRLREN